MGPSSGDLGTGTAVVSRGPVVVVVAENGDFECGRGHWCRQSGATGVALAGRGSTPFCRRPPLKRDPVAILAGEPMGLFGVGARVCMLPPRSE